MSHVARWGLWAILAISLLLGLGFARATPVGGAPDEGAHLQYVRFLATQGRLPQLNLEQRRASHADPDYESHQSPVYYALAVPFFLAGKAVAGEAGAGQGCRLLSMLIGLAGTWLIWRVAKEIAPERPSLHLAAAAFAAFLPMRLSVNASVSNDAATEASCSLALLLMMRYVSTGFTLRRALAVGAAVALAMLCKQSSLMLLPVLLLAIYLGARRSAPVKDGLPEEKEVWTRFLQWGAAAGGVLLLLAGPWFLRNHLLYGDPLGQKAFNWYFEDTPRWVQFRDAGMPYSFYFGRLVAPMVLASFWGAFGYLDPRRPGLWMGDPQEIVFNPNRELLPPSNLYFWLGLLLALALVGWVVALIRSRMAPPLPPSRDVAPEPDGRSGVALLSLHGLFVVAAFFNFNATYFQAQGRYLFPALAALSLALCGGWLALGGRKREPLVAGLIVAGMLSLALYALFGVVFPGFQQA